MKDIGAVQESAPFEGPHQEPNQMILLGGFKNIFAPSIFDKINILKFPSIDSSFILLFCLKSSDIGGKL